jgi:hypothetical protein
VEILSANGVYISENEYIVTGEVATTAAADGLPLLERV